VSDPRRSAQPVTEAELTRESEITARDIREDRGFWRTFGSALLQALLNAPEER
jgi:hypothetical protein